MSHRAQIFELRGQTDPATGKPYSYSKIATMLGVSKSLVEKELHRTAREPLPDAEPAGAAAYSDPGLSEARRTLEQERLELMGLDVRAKRMEAQRRLQLLATGGGGDSGATLILMESLRDLRQQIAQIAAQARQPAAPPLPQPTVTDKLTEMRQLGEIVQSFAPAKGPTSILELEARAMLERINAEDRRFQRQFDLEREERMERARGQARRDEAMAMAIEQSLPLIGQALNTWLSNQGQNGNGQAVGAIRPLIEAPTEAAAAEGDGLREGEIPGLCPSCGQQLAVPIDHPGRCPRCQTELAVSDGRIVAAAAEAPQGQIRRMQPVAS